jgi:hypothetical protein
MAGVHHVTHQVLVIILTDEKKAGPKRPVFRHNQYETCIHSEVNWELWVTRAGTHGGVGASFTSELH